MEKASKIKHHQITCPKVIIFKEDLEQLAELFSDNFNEIEIEADGYKLTNISEINELKKDIITDFRIGGRDKDSYSIEMSIDISIKSAYILINSYNDTKCIGVKYKIDDIFKKRRRIINIIESKWTILFTFYFLVYSLVLLLVI